LQTSLIAIWFRRLFRAWPGGFAPGEQADQEKWYQPREVTHANEGPERMESAHGGTSFLVEAFQGRIEDWGLRLRAV
jgi:hypothetical protein